MSEIVRRCIRSTGREFEEGFACEGDPDAARDAAEAFVGNIAFPCDGEIRRLSEYEWSVRWWSAD